MTLTINGVDIVPHIAFRGVKWSRNDVDGPDAGRNMAGTMLRQRVTTKVRLDITCRPLKTSDASAVLTAIMPEYVTVVYTDPQTGTTETKTMYSNNNPANYLILRDNGDEYWDGITFPLVER